MKVSQHILNFLFNLKFNIPLPEDFEVLHPFDNAETKRVCEEFYNKYYGDENKRFCIIGINPGRFGAGLTGIPFTDPIRLERELAIQNEWQKKQELSSVFIYEMIEAFGGPEKFYNKFYFTAVSPLGFVKNGKNINYYDDKSLLKAIPPFVKDCLEQQLSWISTSVAFCLGEGKNFDCLSRLNKDFLVFEKIVPLPHPRFIMQYKLKKKAEYIEKYLKTLNQD
jgi:uracil-DNA glycosylase